MPGWLMGYYIGLPVGALMLLFIRKIVVDRCWK